MEFPGWGPQIERPSSDKKKRGEWGETRGGGGGVQEVKGQTKPQQLRKTAERKNME